MYLQRFDKNLVKVHILKLMMKVFESQQFSCKRDIIHYLNMYNSHKDKLSITESSCFHKTWRGILYYTYQEIESIQLSKKYTKLMISNYSNPKDTVLLFEFGFRSNRLEPYTSSFMNLNIYDRMWHCTIGIVRYCHMYSNQKGKTNMKRNECFQKNEADTFSSIDHLPSRNNC